MPRRNKHGRFIFSASEVGAYVVCPESWRLQSVEKVLPAHAEAIEEGNRLHKEWAQHHDDSVSLLQGIRVVVGLFVIGAVLLAILLYQ